MTQEPSQTREQPEFVVERANGGRGVGFRVTHDPEDQFFPYETANVSSREAAREQAQQRAIELKGEAQQRAPVQEGLGLPQEQAEEPSEEPENMPPALAWGAGPREEPEMAQQYQGPERHRRRRGRREEQRGRRIDLNAILIVVLIGLFGLLMVALLNNGLTQLAESRNGDQSEEQALTGTVDINVNVTGLPENYPEEGVEEPDEEDVNLDDPSRFVLPGGVNNAAEAQRHAESLGYTGISSCNFISKANISLKLASGEMPDMAHIQYRDVNNEISYAYGKLEPEDYYFCSTFSGEVLWMMAKCGNLVKPPSKPPVPPEKKVVRFPVAGIWASCPVGTALPDGTTKRWFPGTTIVVYEWEARAQLRPGDNPSIGWSRAFYVKVRPFLDVRHERVQDFLAKCKKPPTPTPEPPYEPPQPTPTTYTGVGTAPFKVEVVCFNGKQFVENDKVVINSTTVAHYGYTVAQIQASTQQAANTLAQNLAQARVPAAKAAAEAKLDPQEYCPEENSPSWDPKDEYPNSGRGNLDTDDVVDVDDDHPTSATPEYGLPDGYDEDDGDEVQDENPNPEASGSGNNQNNPPPDLPGKPFPTGTPTPLPR